MNRVRIRGGVLNGIILDDLAICNGFCLCLSHDYAIYNHFDLRLWLLDSDSIRCFLSFASCSLEPYSKDEVA